MHQVLVSAPLKQDVRCKGQRSGASDTCHRRGRGAGSPASEASQAKLTYGVSRSLLSQSRWHWELPIKSSLHLKQLFSKHAAAPRSVCAAAYGAGLGEGGCSLLFGPGVECSAPQPVTRLRDNGAGCPRLCFIRVNLAKPPKNSRALAV
ncbi:hypothetical protein NDU88_001973 [Pleurodeles waltl]|uniref:Uncharacterized protein n=1 Tax=Pleurodeles waltl TaxID=8319 RepID=A0AAV7T0Q9_PLEWA|nr:hypothetical protein NDU88_001973 [Pleurodeles waltl]